MASIVDRLLSKFGLVTPGLSRPVSYGLGPSRAFRPGYKNYAITTNQAVAGAHAVPPSTSPLVPLKPAGLASRGLPISCEPHD